MEFKKSKSGKMDGFGVVLVVIAAVILLQSGALSSFLPAQSTGSSGNVGSSASSGASATAAANTVRVVGAPCTQGTTLTASVVRRYTDVAQTAENVTILQNGVLKSTTAHGSSVTVQSGPNADQLELFPAFQSTTFYPVHLSGKLTTCTSSATTGDPLFQIVKNDLGMLPGVTPLAPADTPNHVYQIDTNGNANWFAIVNTATGSVNTGGQGQGTGSNQGNLSIGSGGTGIARVTFTPGYNTALGPVGGNVLACQFPSAVYDSTTPISVSYAGASLSPSPISPSSVAYPLIGANNTVKSFVMPPVDGRVTTTASLDFVIRADSNHNPAGGLDRVNCTIFPTTYYQRQSDGKYVLDIENRDTNAQIPFGVAKPAFEIGIA